MSQTLHRLYGCNRKHRVFVAQNDLKLRKPINSSQSRGALCSKSCLAVCWIVISSFQFCSLATIDFRGGILAWISVISLSFIYSSCLFDAHQIDKQEANYYLSARRLKIPCGCVPAQNTKSRRFFSGGPAHGGSVLLSDA